MCLSCSSALRPKYLLSESETQPSNVRVLIRVRPTLAHERMHSNEVLRPKDSMLLNRKSVGDSMAGMNAHGTSQTYTFDAVMPPECTQEEVASFIRLLTPTISDHCASAVSLCAQVFAGGRVAEMTQAVLQGYNATIFACTFDNSGFQGLAIAIQFLYLISDGQTGSGKTFVRLRW